MGKVVWKRRDISAQPFDLIPSIQEGSIKDFRPPSTIESDFRRLLMHDVPHVNFTFELLHDWFSQFENNYEPVYIRAQQTPIDWKSKIGNSDMSTNFKVTHDMPIHKGDMVIREDGTIYLLNWNVQNHPNNQATQSIECNTRITILRDRQDETDENGFLISDESPMAIVSDFPCVHAEYAGRPDYASSQGAGGIAPDHLISLSLQWNNQTKNIRINDEFVIGTFTYRVINISMAEVNITNEYGVLI